MWSVGKARMTPSVTIAEQAVGAGWENAAGGWGLRKQTMQIARNSQPTTRAVGSVNSPEVSHCFFENFSLAPTRRRSLFCSIYWKLLI